ncbi:MAG: AI-2E family transporter, partial [Bacteroidota bacterium]
VQENFNVTIRAQKEYLDQTAEQMKTTGPAIFERTVLTVTDVLAYIVFVPVYTFLMLYYKDLIKHFIVQVFKNDDENKVREVLQESQSISQQYLTGLLIELAIVFGLNATGFLILGIKYAIFLALVAALLNMVPYIGMLVANIFCMVVTLISSDSVSSVVWVGVTLAAVQIIDNNILLPLIVGSRVQINALVTIIGVLTGGALCGVAGMFLSIPGIAVLKVICERVEDLKPWGVLMGDNGTKAHNGKRGVRRFFSKSRRTAAARR